jgi:hypothetical protein
MNIMRAMILDERLGPRTELRWSLLCPAVRRIINSRVVWRYGGTPNDLLYVAPDSEASIFADEPWMPVVDSVALHQAPIATIEELRRQHQVLIDACERKLDEEIKLLCAKNAAFLQEFDRLEPGDYVLVDMRERPHKSVSSPWHGPYMVIEQREDEDGARPCVTLQHLATKKVEDFHVKMLKKVSLEHFDNIEDVVPLAAKDVWEYEMDAILDHQPRGPRVHKVAGRNVRRSKEEYSFKVLWKDWPLDDNNPSWEPWDNQSLRQTHVFEEYCKRAEVAAELGPDFANEQEEEAPQGKRRR